MGHVETRLDRRLMGDYHLFHMEGLAIGLKDRIGENLGAELHVLQAAIGQDAVIIRRRRRRGEETAPGNRNPRPFKGQRNGEAVVVTAVEGRIGQVEVTGPASWSIRAVRAASSGASNRKRLPRCGDRYSKRTERDSRALGLEIEHAATRQVEGPVRVIRKRSPAEGVGKGFREDRWTPADHHAGQPRDRRSLFQRLKEQGETLPLADQAVVGIEAVMNSAGRIVKALPPRTMRPRAFWRIVSISVRRGAKKLSVCT